MTTALLKGFSLGASLIIAIGSQNAFVLKQGLRREHVFTICTICFLCDAALILFGVAGFGARVLTPQFRKPLAWRCLDILIGCIMWGIGATLVLA